MTNPETCRHWVIHPLNGVSALICFSCGDVFDEKLPFGRTRTDYIWNEEYLCWEYQSPAKRKKKASRFMSRGSRSS